MKSCNQAHLRFASDFARIASIPLFGNPDKEIGARIASIGFA
jgi:hypothetical protein